MNSREIYKRFKLKFNNNDSNEGIDFLPSHFVLSYNNEQIRWLSEKLNGDNVKQSRLDRLLVPDLELSLAKTYSDSVDYQLPEDFYRHASSYSVCDRGNCKDVKVVNFEKKPLTFTVNLSDDFNKPQFDFAETPFVITDNLIKVFFDDFQVRKVFLTYYKAPTDIDIEGYPKFDGSPSTNIDSDLHPDNIDEILDRLVLELKKQEKDIEGLTLAQARIKQER